MGVFGWGFLCWFLFVGWLGAWGLYWLVVGLVCLIGWVGVGFFVVWFGFGGFVSLFSCSLETDSVDRKTHLEIKIDAECLFGVFNRT